MTTTGPANTSWLRVRFAARLLAERPSSVLDVGAGAGALLATLRAAGVRARGTEVAAPSVAALVADGFDAVQADATRLPFADGAFDWVAMRHVPHHLDDPAAGVREALRVARRGLLVAEPWYDERIPSQSVALAVENWCKREERRAGRVHGENIPAADLLAFAGVDLEEPAQLTVDITHHLCLRRRSTADVLAEVEPWLARLAPAAPERAQWLALAERIALDGVSWNGSAVVAIAKAAGAEGPAA
jgi:SAM-dependent methyltransferase